MHLRLNSSEARDLETAADVAKKAAEAAANACAQCGISCPEAEQMKGYAEEAKLRFEGKGFKVKRGRKRQPAGADAD